MDLSLRPATQQALAHFRQRRHHLLRLRALLCAATIALAAFTGIALLDRAWFMPDALRPWLSLLVYAGAIFAAWRVAWRFIAQAKDRKEAAKLIESAEPSLRERLLAAVELADPQAGVQDSAAFRAKLQEDVAAAVEGIDWKANLSIRSLKPWFIFAGGVVAFVFALSCVPALHLRGFLARAALPFANLPRPASVKIHILEPANANALAPIGSEVSLVLETEGEHPVQATLETLSPGSSARRSGLAAVGSTRFEGVIPVGQNDVRYRIHAGDAITPWYTLSARARPRITTFTKTIIPPSYTGFSQKVLSEEHGDLEALEGSTIKLELKSNQPLSHSKVVLNPETPSREKFPTTSLPANTLAAEIAITPANATWQIALKSAETGFTNEESTPWRITAIPDTPPTAQITEPTQQIELLPDEAVRLAGIVTDDVGISGIKITHTINGADSKARELPFTKRAKEIPVQALLPLAPLGVKSGDAVMVKLIAVDLKGQITESTPLRVIILEQTIDPRQRAWTASQRRLALQTQQLEEQTRELAKDIAKVRKTEKNARKANDAAKNEADNALAGAQQKLEQVKAQSNDLWNALKEAARDAPNPLNAAETRLLGARLSQLRRENIAELEKLENAEIDSPEQIKRAAQEAHSTASLIATAARAFASADSAKIASQEAQQLQRQSRTLTDNALQANRDANQRSKWHEQQRALVAHAKTLQKDLQQLDAAQEGRNRSLLHELDKKITETASDLESSLDKPDQTKQPEHLYGTSDNLRSRLQQTADAMHAIAEQTAQEAQQRREQLARQDNPALDKLEDAKNALTLAEQAARTARPSKRDPRDGMTAAEKAHKDLAQAAKQLQDQAELREQNQSTNNQSALDMNRASRAADDLAQQTAQAESAAQAMQPEIPKGKQKQAPPSEAQKAMQKLKEQVTQLAQAARALEADALIQEAAQALTAAQAESQRPSNRQDLAHATAQTRAAAEALRQLPEKIARARIAEEMQKTDPQAANTLRQTAQQASDVSRNAEEQSKALLRTAAQQPPGQPLNTQPAQLATAEAQKKADELASQLQPRTEAARAQLAALTPEVSEMMQRVAADLKKTQEQTQTAANEAKAEKPVDQVAQKAQALRPEAAADAEKMEALQAALRQEANAADLTKKPDTQMARTADVALAQMRQKSPQIAQNLKQAAQATQSQPQAQDLQAAADTQQQTAQAMEQLAQNMRKMEQGQQLTDADLAAMKQMEQELGVQKPLDEAYQRAQQLAAMAQDAQQNPQAVLAALEQELPKNPAMQKALAESAKDTAQQAEQAIAKETQQLVQNGMAQKQAANDLSRVARHQQRLGHKETAQQIAEASSRLQQAGQKAEAQQANPQPDPQAAQQSQASAAQAAKAAEATAGNTAPPLLASPLEQLQGQMLAQALDQLDAQLHPMQSQNGQQQQQAQNGQPQQGGQQQGQQAQNSLNQAQQSQQQSMADARNQGKAPGQKPGQQQMAQNQQQGQNTQAQSSEGGNQSTELKDSTPGQLGVLLNGDWGHLPQKMADDLSEATRSESAPEYRAAIESYYKAIATKAKR